MYSKGGPAYGKGPPVDAIKAVEWFRKAAAKGNAGAQYSLGAKYASGSGVAKNPTQSAVKKQRGQHVDAS